LTVTVKPIILNTESRLPSGWPKSFPPPKSLLGPYY
jgi:hypothetical protein